MPLSAPSPHPRFYDENGLSLFGVGSVVGRSIVLHKNTTERLACADIGCIAGAVGCSFGVGDGYAAARDDTGSYKVCRTPPPPLDTHP